MTRRAAAGHAYVRVGPIGPGSQTLVAGWSGLRHEGHGRCGEHNAVTGTLIAAGNGAPVPILETADIIMADGTDRSGPGRWLRQYPGCGIAVSRTGPGIYSAAARDGVPCPVTVSGPDSAGPLACAAFAYGWLAAGWPLDRLRPALLRVGPVSAGRPEPGERLFFRFAYCDASGPETPESGATPSTDSAVRTCSASGAPSAS